MESDEATVPPEQALTEALLALSWPLPRTVEDADAALTRLEGVRAVLTLLEQQSVGGAEAWWAGQVDALATQSGFVLEWWRPVLRDPELDWTLNHQAHLTADLATLASAGARLLDQIEPQGGAEANAGATGGRRAADERRWGPSAVLPFAAGAGANVPGARPQPPGEVFGGDAGNAGDGKGAANAGNAGHGQTQGQVQAQSPTQGAVRQQVPGTPAPGDLEPPQFPPLPSDPQAAQPPAPEALNAGAARHRRPSYEFDDAEAASAEASIPAPPLPPAPVQNAGAPTPAPQPVIPPGSPTPPPTPAPGPPATPGQTSAPKSGPAPVPPAGPPAPAPLLAPAPSAQGPGFPRRAAHGFPSVADEPDEEEPARLVPTGLRRHQRRLLMQTAAILIAIAVLCWWAVYTLSSNPSHPAASSTHTSGESTAAGGVGGAPGTTGSDSAAPSPSGSGSASASKSPQAPTTSAAPAPSTGTSTVADGTTVSSARVTLLGGSPSVPQIVVLITVHTAGTGPVNVLGSYYGAKGGGKVAPETDHWTFSGHTSYQYSVPIANGAYCASTFHFTLTAGGTTDTGTTSPGC